jgi:polyisoprenoid-binding protein YceI
LISGKSDFQATEDNGKGDDAMTDTTTAPAQTSTTTWNIDPAHSMAEFKVKHMMIANVYAKEAEEAPVA